MLQRWIAVGLLGALPLAEGGCTSYFPLAGNPASVDNRAEASGSAKAPLTRQVVIAVSGMT